MPQLADLTGGIGTDQVVPADGCQIVSQLLTQRISKQGKLIDVMLTGFTIDGYPGTFYIHPDANGQWQAATPLYMAKERDQIEAIYALGG